jgi:hypothetical protein
MKKTVSVVYTVFVVVALLGVIAFFGWKTYQSRSARIGDFTANADIYTEKLADSLSESRDVNAEVAIAESIMNEDPSLIAIQVYSHDDGLRLSVVKPPADEFSRTSLADSEKFDNWLTKIRYHKEIRPMSINDMRGLEAVYVSTTLSSAEIQNNLMIILITIIGLFAITLVLILVRPRSGHADEQERDEESQFSDDMDEFSIPDDMNEEMNDSMTSADDDFDLPDFDPQDRLDESDLMSGDPEFGNRFLLMMISIFPTWIIHPEIKVISWIAWILNWKGRRRSIRICRLYFFPEPILSNPGSKNRTPPMIWSFRWAAVWSPSWR